MSRNYQRPAKQKAHMAKIGANQATSEVITMFSNGIMISVPPEMRLSGITYKEPPKG